MCICYAHWDHSSEVWQCFELTWGSFGWGIIALDIRLLCISVYTLRARKSAPQALHLGAKCAKHAEWTSERWKHMKAKAGHVQYYGLHLAGALWLGFDSDWMLSFSEHSRQAHLFWGVALLTIAPDYTAFGSQRPKSRCLATMTIDDVLVRVGYLKF